MFNTEWIISPVQLLLVFLVTVLIVLYFQYRQTYKYWTKLGIEQLNPIFPVGDLSTSAIGLKNVIVRIQQLYNQFKEKNQQFGGIYFYNGPIFLPISPELMHRILVSDFEYFTDRGLSVDETNPLSVSLLNLKHQEWKPIRTKITPQFTSMKIKNMSHIFFVNAKNLIDVLKNQYSNGDDFDMKQLAIHVTSDSISAAGLGIEQNSLKNPDKDFVEMVEKVFDVPRKDLIQLALTEGLSNPGNILKLIQNHTTVKQYFTGLIQNIVEYRTKNNIVRDDFLSALIQLKNKNMITMNNIIGESYLIFLAGYETSASSMSFALHELAHNQQIQDRLREEIYAQLGKDVGQYQNQHEHILTLPYLDMVFNETLRKYPPTTTLFRHAVKPYNIPHTDIVLPNGTPVIVSIFAMHRDPEYFPDPLKFDPERFDSEKNTILPNTYLPFGDGPRYCLGKRFAISLVKIMLTMLIANFKFLPGKKSQRELTILPSTSSPVIQTQNGVNLKVIKL